ncbi:MAG TPA: hypothetical protein VFK89_12365 [Actinomycetota bacterium]|nr:hypothetical protein [Actinomycetota bacterium]
MPTSDPNADYEPKPLDPSFEEKVESLAHKLMRGGDGNDVAADDLDSARRTARRMLEDSEARTTQATELDPDDDADVIRRTSGESAATGDAPGVRYSNDGE